MFLKKVQNLSFEGGSMGVNVNYPLIGQEWLQELETGLWLVESDHMT